ncbi:hypothetical protein ENSA5_36270 [Enhygromyxa salina]|uniref:Orc1-like AAA ATPase domain-containing protein n=1 Tax=Enhygromyxa salina TaxID=215803 RepID=A0A2S9XV12_9BACT|nr:hypothetical protein [Enhygromyxa salina]PRP96551.1 hypothetical protein ENSA5_36270 [Enhygromyxa salina]
MSQTRDAWRRLYKVCDPKERLHIDELNLFVERPDSAARRIANSLEGGFDEQGKWIICGSVGTGKSTELTKLAEILHDSYLVVGVDLWRASARIDEVSAAEILFCIGAAAVRTAQNQFGHQVDPALKKHLTTIFAGLLEDKHNVEVADLVEGVTLLAFDLLAPGASGAVKSALGAARAVTGAVQVPIGRPKLGGLTRPVKDGDPALDKLVWAVDQILADVAQIRAPLVLVDGLDKLTKIDSIRDLFATSRVLAKPRAPLVYTGPVTLMLAAEWSAAANYFDRARLANLVVAEPTSPHRRAAPEQVEAGRAAARGIIARRCGAAGVDISRAIAEDALELLVTKSGGLTRQLLQLVREAAKIAGMAEAPVVDETIARSACEEWRKEFEITMTGIRRKELEYIDANGEPQGGQVSHELLLWNYAIPYANGDMWFSPNPLIDLHRT